MTNNQVKTCYGCVCLSTMFNGQTFCNLYAEVCAYTDEACDLKSESEAELRNKLEVEELRAHAQYC
jgi:hypothetical protein